MKLINFAQTVASAWSDIFALRFWKNLHDIAIKMISMLRRNYKEPNRTTEFIALRDDLLHYYNQLRLYFA